MGKRIVIVGGGFGGAATAARLEKLFRREPDVEIVLFDRENFSVFTPLLPGVPSGALEPKHIVSPLRARLARTSVRQAEVRAIDVARRLIVAGHCPRCAEYVVEYDYLVLALGSVTNFLGLPGVAERARTMKSLADGAELHDLVIGKFEHADLESDCAARRRLLTFVVAGGGFAGVETAAELNDFVRAAGRGVGVLLRTRIQACEDDCVQLSGETTLPSQTLIWTTGVSPHPLLDEIDLPRDAGGRIQVDSTLAVPGRANVFAVGDCAAVRDLATGKLYPPTAQYAIREGAVVADNVAAAIRSEAPRHFRYRPLGMLASLGRHSAVAEILGFKFSGFVAWWLWRTVYLMKLPGIERKVRVVFDWTLDLFFPRDIVYLRGMHAIQGEAATGIAPDPHAAHEPLAAR